VERLAILKEHEVGYIYEVVDRSHSDRAEKLLHPEGAGPHLKAADHTSDIATTALRGLNLNWDRLPLHLWRQLDLWALQRQPRQSRQLSGNPQMS